ncbi:sulfite exporter TauE/SafE family protein [Kroppenstedtia eburnea]|uniref:sulfite exporter TauE/SafE family protein n=1 Tax=Kroppenstedtia eburnea TaxID=714067 RepID=UPI00020C9686|nr:putative membrane protein [Desmospora sp. 8437]
MEDWILLLLVVWIASMLQTSTGYGFSIIGTPFLLIFYPAHTAIQINMILSLCISAVMIFRVRSELDKFLLIRLIKGSGVGLVLGLFLYLYSDVQWLKVSVGALILVSTVMLILKVSIKQTSHRDLIAGGISGFLTTGIGVPGPPLLLYFAGTGTEKETLRSTTLAYYLFVYSISLVLQISFGGTAKEVWISSLYALPALFIGILSGQLLFKWMNPQIFKTVTYIILLVTGLYLLVSRI